MLIVSNPATGEEIGRVAKHTSAQVKAAVDRTCAAFAEWSGKLAKERSDILRRWHDSGWHTPQQVQRGEERKPSPTPPAGGEQSGGEQNAWMRRYIKR